MLKGRAQLKGGPAAREGGLQLPAMTRAEEEFRAWLRSPQRIFVPRPAERYAQGRSLGLSRQAVRDLVASEPELTRLRSGRIPKRQSAFRHCFWHEAELDLGFLNWNGVAHGTFFLGKGAAAERGGVAPPAASAGEKSFCPFQPVLNDLNI